MKRKRIYLINRDFQFRYTGAAALVGMLSTALSVLVLLFPLYQFEILKIPVFLPIPILGCMVAAVLTNIFFVAGMGIIVTHRIAGPMYSMVRHFRRIEEGLWHTPMRLRDGDEMKYLMRNFNGMLDGLNKICIHDRDDLETILGTLDNPEQGVDTAKQQLRDLIARLEQRLGKDQHSGEASP